MKRMYGVLLALVLLLSCTGCAAPQPEAEDEIFSFCYQNIRITPGEEAAPILAALGEPKGYTESASCAFDGLDKTYDYGSFCLTTYPLDGKDYVYLIWLVDDSVSTEDGIRLGDSQAEVEALCGGDCFQGGSAYIRTLGNSRCRILLTDGQVSSIQYEMLIQ